MTDPKIETLQGSANIQTAAQWLAVMPDEKRPQPLVPYLKREFGLSSGQAIEAMRESWLIKARAS
ncbi:hypothetical protein ABFT80_27080 [Mesorhizobium sp. SB112]|uniref:hypothetical protein n=1 Tax=Mesorhizobium sp. SB112 TaxID=3151853 RepID=UPI0032663B81